MRIKARLGRLEAAAARARGPDRPRTYDEAMAAGAALWPWLVERGYPDCLAALEAGEAGPAGCEWLLREQAAYDPKRRAFARVEAALAAHELLDPADIRLLRGGA